jgi:hypothetical protein
MLWQLIFCAMKVVPKAEGRGASAYLSLQATAYIFEGAILEELKQQVIEQVINLLNQE